VHDFCINVGYLNFVVLVVLVKLIKTVYNSA